MKKNSCSLISLNVSLTETTDTLSESSLEFILGVLSYKRVIKSTENSIKALILMNCGDVYLQALDMLYI